MTDKAAFRATFSDWRLVKTRGVIQLVFEVPLQEADRAYQVVGGMPNAAEERWFGIARLVSGDVAQEREGADTLPGNEAPSRASPKSYAQQAGILCNDPLFKRFCDERLGAKDAVGYVYGFCGVESRREILAGSPAAVKWNDLVAQFKAWKFA